MSAFVCFFFLQEGLLERWGLAPTDSLDFFTFLVVLQVWTHSQYIHDVTALYD